MEPHLPLYLKTLPAFLLSVVAGFFLVFFLPTTAVAADGTSCGATECYVETAVRGESNWRDYMTETTSTGSGSSVTPNTTASFYSGCDTWLPVGGGTSTHTYPVKNSGSMACHFSDGGQFSTGTGEVWFLCPPKADRAANGRLTYLVKGQNSAGEDVWVYARYRCLYPTDANAPIERPQGEGKVYTGGKATFLYTSTVPTNPANTTHGSGGTVASTTGYVNRGVNLSNPEAYVGEWRPSFTATTARDGTGQPIYSYYRLDWTLDYRVCVKWAYPSWLGVPARYDCSRSGTDISANPYTYACNLNPPLRAGVDPAAVFVPADCASSWRCEVRDPTTVGGQPALVAVMRNGTDIPVTFPTPTVFGDGVRDPRRWQMNPTPSKDATPKLTYVTQSWSWDKWQAFKPNGTIAFHWASDKEHPFTWNTKYRFTADFYLPTQNTVGGASTYEWVTDITQCPETSNSPTVEVVRAVNK